MLVAVFTIFAASRKEPLADMVERVHAAFLEAGFGEPTVRFSLADPPGSLEASLVQAVAGINRVSSIERALKRWPELERFTRVVGSAAQRGAKTRVMSNLTAAGPVEPIDFAVLKEIARGVPRSFPCHGISLHFSAAGFSEGPELPAAPDPRTLGALMRAGVDIGAGHPTSAGVSVQDSWWVNGRQRSLAALRVIEADQAAKNLPAPPGPVASVFAACGNVRKTIQLPLVIGAPGAEPERVDRLAAGASEPGEALRSVMQAYRVKMTEFLETLPHDLPEQDEATRHPEMTAAGMPATGPKKPDLVRAFAPMGYDCRGESGSFTLQRRTPGNLTVKLRVDVGTWGSAVMASLQVIGLIDGKGFKATLSLPVSRRAVRHVGLPSQFPIGSPIAGARSSTILRRSSRRSIARSFPRSRRYPVPHRSGSGRRRRSADMRQDTRSSSASRPCRSCTGEGGQPRMWRSTGMTASTPPATA